MIGSVRLKSKSAAFSISAASDGGAKASELAAAAAPRRERDFGFSFGRLRAGTLGSGGSLGVGGRELVVTGIMHLEEAMIKLAMATALALALRFGD